MPARQANKLSLDPVYVPMQREPAPEGTKPLEHAEYLMHGLKDRQKEDERRSLSMDICESCAAQLRKWIETQLGKG
jgi:hypothetical protein